MHQYVQNLGQVAREIGVKVRCGARVEQLRMEVVLDADAEKSNHEDDDDKDNVRFMAILKSYMSLLICRMVEWQEWCWTPESRFL